MTIVLTPTSIYTTTLQGYVTDVQRLLHDSTYRYWTQAELIDYINAARRKVAAETGCLRQLVQNVPVDIGTSSFDLLSILSTRRVTGVLDIYLFYSTTTRYPLRYFVYSDFSRQGSVMYSYQGVPIIWSQLGDTAYISPVPAQAYVADFDVAIEPIALTSLTSYETELFSPFTNCVKFYAAYLAKLKDQRRAEAESFLLDYMRERSSGLASGVIRRLVGR